MTSVRSSRMLAVRLDNPLSANQGVVCGPLLTQKDVQTDSCETSGCSIHKIAHLFQLGVILFSW